MIETYCRLQYNTVPNIQAKGQLFSTAHANQIGFSSSLLAPRSDFDIRDIAGFTGSFFSETDDKKSGQIRQKIGISGHWAKLEKIRDNPDFFGTVGNSAFTVVLIGNEIQSN